MFHSLDDDGIEVERVTSKKSAFSVGKKRRMQDLTGGSSRRSSVDKIEINIDSPPLTRNHSKNSSVSVSTLKSTETDEVVQLDRTPNASGSKDGSTKNTTVIEDTEETIDLGEGNDARVRFHVNKSFIC